MGKMFVAKLFATKMLTTEVWATAPRVRAGLARSRQQVLVEPHPQPTTDAVTGARDTKQTPALPT